VARVLPAEHDVRRIIGDGDLVADGEVGLTLLLDVGSWFLDQGGNALLDPAALSQQDRSRVEQNIRQSFHAFEDDDADGEDE